MRVNVYARFQLTLIGRPTCRQGQEKGSNGVDCREVSKRHYAMIDMSNCGALEIAH